MKSHFYKLTMAWVMVLTSVAFAACSDDEPEPVPEPEASTFHVSISGVIDYSGEEYGIPIVEHNVYMRGSELPSDEKILLWGAAMSSYIKNPTVEDSKNYLMDAENDQLFSEWDWSEDLYYVCCSPINMMPGREYYVRGYVKTDRGEYYTEPITISTDKSVLQERPHPKYIIPVVFNVFPDENGDRIPEEQILEQFEWANLTYRNAFGVDGLEDTGIELELADLPGLDRPGFRYFDEPLIMKLDGDMDEMFKPEWRTDISKAVNIWVAPIIGQTTAMETEAGNIAGFSDYPIFNPGEEMEGCYTIKMDKPVFPQRYGVAIASASIYFITSESALAHELGHFLGLANIFEEDYCDDTYLYDRNLYLEHYYDWGIYRPYDLEQDQWWISTNIMDYSISYQAGVTAQQKARMLYTLEKGLYTPWHPYGSN